MMVLKPRQGNLRLIFRFRKSLGWDLNNFTNCLRWHCLGLNPIINYISLGFNTTKHSVNLPCEFKGADLRFVFAYAKSIFFLMTRLKNIRQNCCFFVYGVKVFSNHNSIVYFHNIFIISIDPRFSLRLFIERTIFVRGTLKLLRDGFLTFHLLQK